MENQLISNNIYLLKWNSIKPDGSIHNMVVLKCQFIKYFNNNYCRQFIHYKINDIDAPEELVGNILTDNLEIITYPFDHPLYPYSRFFKGTFNNGCNLGLFKVLSIENSIFKGKKQPFRGNNPYKFVTLNSNTLINTPQIIYNETLIWVDLDKVKIRPYIDKMKLLQEKAVNSLPLIEDVKKYNIHSYLGGIKKRIKRNKSRKGSINKRKINNKHKTRKYNK